ncbi:MAG: FeoB-associated Cys-rich membrane protein [Clostridia bacterium]|nr:FeoB-associated Cys-rich membrane protein [Clostridia bacterium]
MNPASIVILCVVGLLFVLAVANEIRKKIQKKSSGCSCCGDCKSCHGCTSQNTEE